MLAHYIETTEPLSLDRLEHEIVVSIPSRTGQRRSNRYRLQAFFDGIHTDDQGRVWIVDFKLRGQLTSYELVVLNRQYRIYAWAAREALDIEPAGFMVDERLNEAPKPVRVLKSGAPSHAKDQLTTPDRYIAACQKAGVDVEPTTLEALRARRWQARHRVIFRPGELDETADQLVSAAKLVHQLDTGELAAARNPSRARCPGCPYREICADPVGLADLIDMTFERKPPKRLRDPLAPSPVRGGAMDGQPESARAEPYPTSKELLAA
jgi:PD-(D/E)XK nuclease superfamily